MASIPTLPSLQANATMAEVIDHVALLQKTLTFMMSSNLGTTNIAEVGGWLLDDTQIIAENNTVGLSSTITAVNDIRIWAGDSVADTAPFRVYEDGSVFASKLTMTGGSIQWSSVTKPSYAPGEVGAVADDQQSVFNTLTDNGLRRGLFLSAGELYINADYMNTGTLRSVDINVTRDITIGNNIYFNPNESFANKSLNFGGRGSLTFRSNGVTLSAFQQLDLQCDLVTVSQGATTSPIATQAWASANIVAKFG